MKIIKIYNQTLTLEEQVCEVLCFIKKMLNIFLSMKNSCQTIHTF